MKRKKGLKKLLTKVQSVPNELGGLIHNITFHIFLGNKFLLHISNQWKPTRWGTWYASCVSLILSFSPRKARTRIDFDRKVNIGAPVTNKSKKIFQQQILGQPQAPHPLKAHQVFDTPPEKLSSLPPHQNPQQYATPGDDDDLYIRYCWCASVFLGV